MPFVLYLDFFGNGNQNLFFLVHSRGSVWPASVRVPSSVDTTEQKRTHDRLAGMIWCIIVKLVLNRLPDAQTIFVTSHRHLFFEVSDLAKKYSNKAWAIKQYIIVLWKTFFNIKYKTCSIYISVRDWTTESSGWVCYSNTVPYLFTIFECFSLL